MVDLSAQEKEAIRHSMKMAAEVMNEIGWETRLLDLSEHQVLTLIEVVIDGFQQAMREITAADPEVPF
jgi:hypothetical protein